VTAGEVREALQSAAGVSGTTAAERIHAQETLEDLGTYSVPHLAALLHDPELATRNAAAYFLRLAAMRPLEDPFNPRPSAELRAKNRDIDAENATLRTLRYTPEDSEE